jgi:benzylsuccinate CoA-transferase BbsF subunit
MALADMGAEIIKIESNRRIDVCRVVSPYADGVLEGVNRGGQFNTFNRNKKSCTLDLSQQKGREIAKKLVLVSDVVVENFSPPVMKRLGLDYEVCKALKPDIVYLSLSGYGATGPNSSYVSYGMQLQAFSGLGCLTGYENGPPRNIGTAVSDTVGGLTGAFGILAALHHRQVTGEGQHIDVSQCEGLASFCPEAILDFIMNERVHGRVGNRDDKMAPHGVYRCKGENNWVSIAVSTEEEWRDLCEVIERPDLLNDQRFADVFARQGNQVALDEIIADWCIRYSDYEAMKMLQDKGVPAAAVLSNAQMVSDPHLRARGFCVEDDHPAAGKRTIGGFSLHLNRTPGGLRSSAPLLGEHNQEIFCDLLGMSQDELDDLVRQEVIY